MMLTSTILVATVVSAIGQSGTPQDTAMARQPQVISIEADFAATNQTGDSRTKPVSAPLARESMDLKQIPFKIVHETYRETDRKLNWEIFIMNADGSDPVNLTNTPDIDEMYPHVSPDGTKICFVADEGPPPGQGPPRVLHEPRRHQPRPRRRQRPRALLVLRQQEHRLPQGRV